MNKTATKMVNAAALERGMRLALDVYGETVEIAGVTVGAAYVTVRLVDGRKLDLLRVIYRDSVEVAA